MRIIALTIMLAFIILACGCCSTSSSTQSNPAPANTVSTPAHATTVSTSAPAKTVSTPAQTLKQDSASVGERNAANKALSYLRTMAFSRDGLIKQLEFEKFSHQEAVYGVDQSGADWNEQAAKKAASYLKTMSFSRSGLIDQLEYEGFTPQQAEYGVRAAGY
jgi:hypothetical protein